MGITKLMPLIREKAPRAIRERQLDAFTGRIVACDASMSIYQFIISTTTMNAASGVEQMTDKNGTPTAHLQGILNRTVQLLENGIKPIWVFDGKPPALKDGEIAERKKAKEEATKKFEEAKEAGNIEEANKALSRTTKVTTEMTDDAKKLVQLLGAPMIVAETEAEAQCAAIVKAGKAWATVSEDMDTLTFGSKYLLRGLNAKKDPINEICLEDVLTDFEMTNEEFINLCILCGCDYLKNIDGIGPITAFKLIKEHKDIEGVLKKLEEDNADDKKKKKYHIPANYDIYPRVRDFFRTPDVTDPNDLEIKWGTPDEEALKDFLCGEKNFNEVRIENALARLKKSASKSDQKRLDSFFTLKRPAPSFAKKAGPESKKLKANSGKKIPAKGRGKAKK